MGKNQGKTRALPSTREGPYGPSIPRRAARHGVGLIYHKIIQYFNRLRYI
jgi:hypothetical protein